MCHVWDKIIQNFFFFFGGGRTCCNNATRSRARKREEDSKWALRSWAVMIQGSWNWRSEYGVSYHKAGMDKNAKHLRATTKFRSQKGEAKQGPY
jgi:hypothetical protein